MGHRFEASEKAFKIYCKFKSSQMKMNVKSVNPLTINIPLIQLICRANQLTGFYVSGTLIVKGLMFLTAMVDYISFSRHSNILKPDSIRYLFCSTKYLLPKKIGG